MITTATNSTNQTTESRIGDATGTGNGDAPSRCNRIGDGTHPIRGVPSCSDAVSRPDTEQSGQVSPMRQLRLKFQETRQQRLERLLSGEKRITTAARKFDEAAYREATAAVRENQKVLRSGASLLDHNEERWISNPSP